MTSKEEIKDYKAFNFFKKFQASDELSPSTSVTRKEKNEEKKNLDLKSPLFLDLKSEEGLDLKISTTRLPHLTDFDDCNFMNKSFVWDDESVGVEQPIVERVDRKRKRIPDNINESQECPPSKRLKVTPNLILSDSKEVEDLVKNEGKRSISDDTTKEDDNKANENTTETSLPENVPVTTTKKFF